MNDCLNFVPKNVLLSEKLQTDLETKKENIKKDDTDRISDQDKLAFILSNEDNELFTENYLEGVEAIEMNQITPPKGFEHVKPKFLLMNAQDKWDMLMK